jgi:hypothetical protein
MTTWAIVVGINDYPGAPGNPLPGCVHDALLFSEWLLDPLGGDVKEFRLFLLLSPWPDPLPERLQRVNRLEPTYRGFVEAVRQCVLRSGGEADRLFFYFSGHGCAYKQGAEYIDGLMLADFEDEFPNHSMSVESLVAYLRTTQLRDQFLFLDCCRNERFEGVATIGTMPTVPPRPADWPAVQSFVYFGTQPGLTAVQMADVPQPHSIFTESLLAALRGAGWSKVRDPKSKNYVVRPERLFEYVRTALESQQQVVDEQQRIQLPQKEFRAGAAGRSSDPVIVEIPEHRVNKEQWNIWVAPSDVLSAVSLAYHAEFGKAAPVKSESSLPLKLLLEPRAYVLSGEAAGYRPDAKSGWDAEYEGWYVELYQCTDTKVAFERAAPKEPGK